MRGFPALDTMAAAAVSCCLVDRGSLSTILLMKELNRFLQCLPEIQSVLWEHTMLVRSRSSPSPLNRLSVITK